MGILWAIGICGAWISSLIGLLGAKVGFYGPHLSFFEVSCMVLLRTFLHTGLFVVAHDAIHGSLCPDRPSLNARIGHLMLGLYAFLPYDRSYTNHWLHHYCPAQICDPDFHDGLNTHPVVWYFNFMAEYLPFTQLLVFLAGWVGLLFTMIQVCGVHWENVVLFWVLPLILSSMQLFFFGTYLPHRGPHPTATHPDRPSHRARTSNYPIIVSFLTCYHFGYHWEHHEYPRVPWYQLPAVHFNKRRNLVIDHVNASK